MLKQSEAIVLRTYDMREADLLVTAFTRAEGKVKGVARSARKSRKRFGGALEPLTVVRLYWEDREKQDLARIDSAEVLQSPLTDAVDYARSVGLAHVAEMLDELLPDREANDAIFRLGVAVLAHMQAGAIWMPVTYFDLWLVRLVGFLPELDKCVRCGTPLNGHAAYFHALVDGLLCSRDKRLASSELSADSRRIAAEVFRVPIDAFGREPWPKARAADLRKLARQIFERHIEKKLLTSAALERLT